VLGSAAPMAAVGGCCPPVVPAAPAVGPAPASRAAISLVRLSISVVHGPAAAAPTGRTSRAHAPNRNAIPRHDRSILSVAALSRTAPRVKFRPAQFHIVASQLPCVGRKLRPQQAWVHSVGNRGCIYWPFSGPSEPPCRTAAIDRSCTICAARGRSGSSVTADKPV
jgi:hypothetical protein